MSFIQMPGDELVNTVSFPGLGLEFDLNRVAFILFGRNVYWYGIIIGIGFLLAVLWCSRISSGFGIRKDDIYDLLIAEVPLSIIGCRAYYVLFNLSEYQKKDGSLDWGAIVRISDGGMAIYGGVIVAALVLWAFCRWRKLCFLQVADLGVQGLMIGQMIGRWGNFMNVEAYGGLTDLPWRMCSESIAGSMAKQAEGMDVMSAFGSVYEPIMSGELGVHPTFLYESLWNLIGLILICVLVEKLYKFNGQMFFTYLTWYGLGRFWIEGLRTDSLYFFDFRISQVVAVFSVLIGGGVLIWKFWSLRGKPEVVEAAAEAAETEVVEESEQAKEETTEEEN